MITAGRMLAGMRSFLCWWCLIVAAGVSAADREALVEIATLSDAERELLGEVREIEQRLIAARSLPVAERMRELGALERPLQRLVEDTRGSRFGNQAVYWLADWVMTYERDLERVTGLLDTLRALPSPAYKGPGRALRVRVLLAQGRVPEAERVALRLVEEVPEFDPILRLVRFSQRIGQPAPRVEGRNLGGGPSDPIAGRSEPWQLFAFLRLGDPRHRFAVHEVLTELAREDYHGRVVVVLVAFDGDPLAALEQAGRLPIGREQREILWANPNEEGDAAAWRRGWQLPELPVTALVGPDRSIMAVAPSRTRLRPLAGLDPDDGSDAGHGALWRGRRRGGKVGIGR